MPSWTDWRKQSIDYVVPRSLDRIIARFARRGAVVCGGSGLKRHRARIVERFDSTPNPSNLVPYLTPMPPPPVYPPTEPSHKVEDL